ncbi:late transcription factor VLTF3-like protein [Catovirus CTV1]|mgnify:CR=1 FL=1|uniref:Late transcription factor VLTF3-like protein n=1 Tax=Catovirus CTV1 TaxID=1977631 RepID=A0A1V0SC98_9VIRU|nr:late transcription factor VLTF3-like protein [Catovirus CTV1]
MSSFRHKPEKLKYLSNINTLDEVHRKQVSEFDSKRSQIPQKKDLLRTLNTELREVEKQGCLTIEDIKKRSQIKEQIEKVTEELYDLENGLQELDYYSKANDILTEYYKMQDDMHDQEPNAIQNDVTQESSEKDNSIPISQKLVELNLLSQQKRKVKKPTRKRIKRTEQKQKQNILSFFAGNSENCGATETSESIASESLTASTSKMSNTEQYEEIEKIVSNKATLFDEYMMLTDRAYMGAKSRINNIKMCTNCDVEKTLIQSEGSYVCQMCGETEHIIIESEVPNHKDATSEKPRYPYKRLNHLIEWLNQFQAKESTEIPDDVYNNILAEIKRQRLDSKIKRLPYMKLRSIIKNILKKLRYTAYYEHVPYIVSKVTHKPPPILSRDVEDRVKMMFKQAQEPFNKFCPDNRINFLNYSYILNKMFRIIKMDEYAQCFPLLKSREKLREQDILWKNICNYLDWEFHPSI